MNRAYWLPRLISFATGFLSLSQELAWMRFVAFLQKGTPYAFSAVLAIYLFGIAGGAWIGKRYCDRPVSALAAVCGTILLISGMFDLAAPWLFAEALGFGKILGYAAGAALIAISSALKSAVFPIVHHMGSQTQHGLVGQSVSTVYFANIIGSTAGPLITGLFLFDVLTLQQVFLAVGLSTIAVAWAVLYSNSAATAAVSGIAAASMAVASALIAIVPRHELIARMVRVTQVEPAPIRMIIENRHGTIHTVEDPGGKDWVYGGNVYDGRVNTDLLHDVNGVWRAYLMAALHPHPKRVMILGLSAGSWARVILGSRSVERVEAVEIDPGYLEIIRRYPEVAGLLDDPRLTVHIDDGRRWLRRHPDQKFDIIVANTTFHWRSYATLLLSQEFLQMARAHLAPGGLMAWNSTVSGDVFKTAQAVFPYVYKVQAYALASNEPVVVDQAAAIERVKAMQFGGASAIAVDDPRFVLAATRRLNELQPFADGLAWESRPLEIITDQNMISEFKYGSIRIRR
ncbi:MAG: hypothetical protein U1E89_03705 [Burkholderiaceae bacterium]